MWNCGAFGELSRAVRSPPFARKLPPGFRPRPAMATCRRDKAGRNPTPYVVAYNQRGSRRFFDILRLKGEGFDTSPRNPSPPAPLPAAGRGWLPGFRVRVDRAHLPPWLQTDRYRPSAEISQKRNFRARASLRGLRPGKLRETTPGGGRAPGRTGQYEPSAKNIEPSIVPHAGLWRAGLEP